MVRKPNYLPNYVTGPEATKDSELHNLAVFSSIENLLTYEEAAKEEVWRNDLDSEIESIENNNTWELTTLSKGAKKIRVKWTNKTKYYGYGKVKKFKS